MMMMTVGTFRQGSLKLQDNNDDDDDSRDILAKPRDLSRPVIGLFLMINK